MSKKDYELIARVLREHRGAFITLTDADRETLAHDFADALGHTNPRFARERFIAACMGQDSYDSAGRTVRYSAR